MKSKQRNVGLVVSAALLSIVTGCAEMQFKTEKTAGNDYYVSVQNLPTYQDAKADSKQTGMLKMGEKFTASAIVPLEGHLQTDQADCWIKGSASGKDFYVPGGAVVSQELWTAQLKGLPPRGGVKVKNFSSAADQETDGGMNLGDSDYRPGDLRLMLGAAGITKAPSKKAYPEELAAYIKAQKNGITDPNLPKTKYKFGELPPLEAFTEIGPYQEFDMGAGLAAFMMPQVINPQHPVAVYVQALVNKLIRKSNAPAVYSGYHVMVLKDDKTINASAAPGGIIYVTTGMLKFVNSEDELAMILAHEIGHIEFHHSARSLGAASYAAFGLSALDAATDLDDPEVKQAIVDSVKEKTELAKKAIPSFLPATEKEKMFKDLDDKCMTKGIPEALAAAQKAKKDALKKMSDILMVVNESCTNGYNVDFEAAADRRAISLGTACGYNPDALNTVLTRIKAKNGGFGEAYPADRDALAKTFMQDYKLQKTAPVGNFAEIQKAASAISDADLFLKK